MPGTLSTPEVAHEIGATYRQVSYWAHQGYIPGMGPVRPGDRRAWSPEQVEAARELLARLEGRRWHAPEGDRPDVRARQRALRELSRRHPQEFARLLKAETDAERAAMAEVGESAA